MKNLKIFTFAILSFSLLINCASAQNKSNRKGAKTNETATGTPNKIRERKPPQFESAGKIEMLAEGTDSSVSTPFVFVARTPETFSQLQKLVKNLPPEKIDFNKTAVVAAFAGEKNTGGYSFDIVENAGKISVNLVAPPKDAFVTQALTTPYAVALVSIERGNSLNLDLSANFSGAMKKYRVTSGQFGFSGGIAGSQKKFNAGGTIGVLTYAKLFTVIFNLTGKAGESGRKLNETVSGALVGEKLSFPRVEAGDFIDRPHRFLIADGIFTGEKLSLEFKSGEPDYVVSDSFEGSGKIEAIKFK
ncbi:MAG TPA: protease complex subunit PrcB family protein [Pyrinomonadaceae bacterium]|nr:protease complex subunit PrcB family protein [Pyrinomonadaceae bacterium]